MSDSDIDYYQRRARIEREAAAHANDHYVRASHTRLAETYEGVTAHMRALSGAPASLA